MKTAMIHGNCLKIRSVLSFIYECNYMQYILALSFNVESSLVLGDLNSLISWVTLIYDFKSSQMYPIVFHCNTANIGPNK